MRNLIGVIAVLFIIGIQAGYADDFQDMTTLQSQQQIQEVKVERVKRSVQDLQSKALELSQKQGGAWDQKRDQARAALQSARNQG